VPLFFVVGAVSQYVGAAIGVFLFQTTEPSTVAWLRAAAAGVALLLWRRPWRSGLTRHDVFVAVQFGLVTIAMNIAFYEAIARIPLGTAVAIEFLGPIAVAALSSRRATDLVAAALVCAGVVLLAGFEFDVNWAGFGFALTAAAAWAGYILLGKRVADKGDGLDSLAVGMAIAAAAFAPFILIPQAFVDSSVFLDPRTWLLGVAVGLLSTAVPYVLDQVVLTVVGRAKFALLLALLPATAAIIGATVLGQTPTLAELFGIGLVMLALLIGARPDGSSRTAPTGAPPT
jgi:inner membrane transporter RhtA